MRTIKVPCTLQRLPHHILLLLFLLCLGGASNLPRAATGFVLPPASSFQRAHRNIMLLSSASQPSAATTTTLGPTALRTIVQNASIESSKCLDLSGIVWLEHLNLVVGDIDLAIKFYVDFIGLSRDSNPKHFNLGQQQVRRRDSYFASLFCTALFASFFA
jgi:hypothetical protein